MNITEVALKKMVDRLLAHSKTTPITPKRSQIQEAVAISLGYTNWHHAITQLKEEAPPKIIKGDWLIPGRLASDDTNVKHVSVEWGDYLPEGASSETESMHKVGFSQLKSHGQIVGAEHNRRQLYDAMFRHNKDRSILFVQGPMSLKLRHWKGSMSQYKTVKDVIMDPKASAFDIVEAFTELFFQNDVDQDMWKKRAISLITAVVFALVWQRDQGGELNVQMIRDHLHLESVQQLSKNRHFPSRILQSLRSYLRSLPGYEDNLPKQSGTTKEQHGYLHMQLSPILDLIEQGKGLFLSDEEASRKIVEGYRFGVKEEYEKLQKIIYDWSQKNLGGLIVLDGWPTKSPLLEFAAQHMPRWGDENIAVWIGMTLYDHNTMDNIISRKSKYRLVLQEKYEK